MSAEPQPRTAPTELETVVNWHLIGAASATALVLLVVPVAAAVLLGPAAPPPAAAPAAPPVALAPQVPYFVLPARVSPAADAPRPESPPSQGLPAPPDPPRPAAPKAPPVTAPAPAAIAAAAPPAVAKLAGFRRLNHVSGYYLREVLSKVSEVDLDAVPGTTAQVQAAAKQAATRPPQGGKATKPEPIEPLAALLAERPDLNGLPFRMGADCRAPAKAVRTMGDISTRLRRLSSQWSRTEAASLSQSQDDQRAQALVKYVKCQQEWHTDDGASTVVQILQPESVYARRQAVTWLSGIQGPRAGAALANLAVFDLSADVREDAVAALRKRPRAEYRAALLRGLRYPWPPAADHAAEALVELRDVSAVPALVGLLDRPPPAAPVRQGGKWVVSELVRVNHLRNCYLCHAPARSVTDPVPGLVPTPGQKLPVVYYQSQRGPFVRADITYLRQDFSVMQRVETPNKWPAWQRFDFLVRTRELPAKEAAALDQGAAAAPPAYPQREAVLFALRELTGEDLGTGGAGWRRFLRGPWLAHEL